jgi:NADH:ubiquinone reductase (H+-translocating)
VKQCEVSPLWGTIHYAEVLSLKHVVIVGGGFAGLNCARKLAAQGNVRVTLIDKNNYQQFQPLLYQVATAALAPSNIAFNLRSVLKGYPSVDVKMAEVVSVDLSTRTAVTAEGQKYQGDFLVLAAGSQPNFFGTPGADQNSYPLYSLRDAELLRSRILAVLESADRDPSLIAKGALNFVIVGAGATGAEMAGAFGDLAQVRKKKKRIQDLAGDEAQIILVDQSHAVLNAFSEKAQAYAAKMLEQRDVQLRLGTSVKEVGSGHVLLSDGTRIQTRTVIWAGGLKASALSSNLGVQPGRGSRIDVQPDLTVKGFEGVYALGDFANIAGKDGKPLPQLASVAEQCGKWCARNIESDNAGQPRKSFDYFDKGIMAMIGRNSAVAEVGQHRHELQGAVAFAAWLGVHAALLTSTRARVESFIEWCWDYFGRMTSDPILDRNEQANINWNDDEEEITGTPDLGKKVDKAS